MGKYGLFMSMDMSDFLKKFNMRKTHKIINIALIFMLIGVFLWADYSFALRPPSIFNLDNNVFIADQRKNKTMERLLNIFDGNSEKLNRAREDIFMGKADEIIKVFKDGTLTPTVEFVKFLDSLEIKEGKVLREKGSEKIYLASDVDNNLFLVVEDKGDVKLIAVSGQRSVCSYYFELRDHNTIQSFKKA